MVTLTKTLHTVERKKKLGSAVRTMAASFPRGKQPEFPVVPPRCTGTRVLSNLRCFLYSGIDRPDMTFVVDLALRTKYLSIYLSIYLSGIDTIPSLWP